MKITASARTSSLRGFTLIELMVVIAIMGLLASFTLMGFSYAQRNAAKSKTEAFIKGISSALERYNADFGEYPEQRSDPMARFGNASYHVGGAMMLYQVLSGDGTSELKLPSGAGSPSDGKVDDNELQNIKMEDMPRDMWKKTADGYLVVDGFGKPFQYTKYVNSTGGTHTASSQTVKVNNLTVNNTFDLWSFGGEESNTTSVDLSVKQNPKVSAKWIKNW